MEEKTDVPKLFGPRTVVGADGVTYELHTAGGSYPVEESQAPPAKLETGVMYDATVNGEEGQVMFFSKEAAEAYSRPSLSLAADGLAEALRKLIYVGDRNTDDWNNARKALDTYERAKKE